MKLKLYQIDAFTSQLFSGNPAAVVPLDTWLPDETLQAIALENNLSETAFFVENDGDYALRWFTPKAEVDLCGHATLATAYVIYQHIAPEKTELHFHSKSGLLKTIKLDEYIQLDFPASVPEENAIKPPDAIVRGGDQTILKVYTSKQDYLVILENEAALKALKPNFSALLELDNRGVIFSAPGDNCDFVSRCFFPKYDVNEDPVTGSAHCVSAPYWANVLGKNKLHARQLSQRGGELICEIKDDRVLLLGKAVPYLEGVISL